MKTNEEKDMTVEEYDNFLVFIEMVKEQIKEYKDIEYQNYIRMKDKNA